MRELLYGKNVRRGIGREGVGAMHNQDQAEEGQPEYRYNHLEVSQVEWYAMHPGLEKMEADLGRKRAWLEWRIETGGYEEQLIKQAQYMAAIKILREDCGADIKCDETEVGPKD